MAETAFKVKNNLDIGWDVSSQPSKKKPCNLYAPPLPERSNNNEEDAGQRNLYNFRVENCHFKEQTYVTGPANFMLTPPESPPPTFATCESLLNPLTTKYGLRNLLRVPTSNNEHYFITRQCSYIFYCWRIRVNFHYPNIANKKILQDERVQEAISRVVSEEMEEESNLQNVFEGTNHSSSVTHHTKRAVKALNELKAALSSTLIRITGYVLFKVFNYLFMSVTVTEGQLQMIEAASKRNVPLIFVPLHRSHVDYLFVTWVLFNRQIPAPIVAAGDNLRMPVFGWILRGLGGFFIKRKLETSKCKKDYVYRALLQTYMSEALREGYNLEFFIEGGRTRTGKPCLPKGGLLSVIVDAFLNGTLEDALIVPIAINYDKLLDGNFVREQLGQNKVPESFWRTVRAIVKVLSTNFGHSRIDFSKPFSLKEFFHHNKISMPKPTQSANNIETITPPSEHTNFTESPVGYQRSYSSPVIHRQSLSFKGNIVDGRLHSTRSSSSLFGTEVTEEYRLFVKSLGSHILFDAESCQAIMSTNAVAWLLSFNYRNGTTLAILADSLDRLREDLRLKKRDSGFSGNSLDATIHALNMLGSSLVQTKGNLDDEPSTVVVKPITTLPNAIELNYYANALAPIYALEAIVATSMITMADCDLSIFCYEDIATECTLPVSKLVDRSKRLCEILKYEFLILPPCKNLDTKIYETIDRFVVCGLLISEMDQANSHYPSRKRYETYSDEDSDESGVGVDVYYSISPKQSDLEMIGMLTRSLSPLIDSYFATISNLNSLIGLTIPDKDFIKQTQEKIYSMIAKGTFLYGESVAVDPIRNATKLMEDEGLIESYTQDSIKLLFVNKNKESESEILPHIKEIQSFRV